MQTSVNNSSFYHESFENSFKKGQGGGKFYNFSIVVRPNFKGGVSGGTNCLRGYPTTHHVREASGEAANKQIIVAVLIT